jgi:hypothetical protein
MMVNCNERYALEDVGVLGEKETEQNGRRWAVVSTMLG